MEFYNLLQKKHDSRDDFIAFLRYMTEQRAYINALDEETKDDFLYHFGKIPEYTIQYIDRDSSMILSKLATISMACDRIKEAVK
jgi:hypothetical protein